MTQSTVLCRMATSSLVVPMFVTMQSAKRPQPFWLATWWACRIPFAGAMVKPRTTPMSPPLSFTKRKEVKLLTTLRIVDSAPPTPMTCQPLVTVIGVPLV